VRRFFDDDRLVRLFSFQSMYAGLAPYEALALYAVITYMDSVSGVFHPDGGMHAIPTAPWPPRPTEAGVRVPLRRSGRPRSCSPTAAGAGAGVRSTTASAIAADAVVCTPTCRSPTARCCPASRRRVGCATASTRRRRGVARRRARSLPAGPPTTTSTSAAPGTTRSPLLFGGRRMPDPSILVTVPTVDEPSMAPPGLARAVRARAGAQPRRIGRLATERDRARDDLVALVARLGYPTDVEVEEFVDPLDWERQQMERGTPFALSHRFRQSGPFRPANVERRAPRAGVRRLGHRARRRRADGAHLRQARRRAGRRGDDVRSR
jgi:phytoene desaturase